MNPRASSSMGAGFEMVNRVFQLKIQSLGSRMTQGIEDTWILGMAKRNDIVVESRDASLHVDPEPSSLLWSSRLFPIQVHDVLLGYIAYSTRVGTRDVTFPRTLFTISPLLNNNGNGQSCYDQSTADMPGSVGPAKTH
ncbi:hypothetical protein WG66_002575 [Moniliophthora roreri]|nr:hypothetical protein WG66_002575 [Moniliophthora roreri]